MANYYEGISQITAVELEKLLSDPDTKIKFIDVRQPEEYVAGHIPGVPLIPMHSIPSYLDEFDPEQEYVFICRSGGRSHEVSKFLKANGIEKVTNFNGGMLSWHGEVKQGTEE